MDTKKITLSNKDLALILKVLTTYGNSNIATSDILRARLFAKKLNQNNK